MKLDFTGNAKIRHALFLTLFRLCCVLPLMHTFLTLILQDVEGARDEAEALASKCLLQDMGGGQYRVHDLLLDFVKIRIKAYDGMVEVATTLQAQYLGRLDVVEGYKNPEHGAGEQGLFFLDALWRSVENLSGDSELEIASYRASLGELESSEATADLANSYSSVGLLFNLQVGPVCCPVLLLCWCFTLLF